MRETHSNTGKGVNMWHLVIVLGIILSVSTGFLTYEYTNPKTCLKQEKVVQILELKYEYAVLQMEDGNTITAFKPTLKPGDLICVKWSR